MVRPPLESSNSIKFLCSYGGKIVPRHPDGELRYHGGHTRVLAVPRSVSFLELLIKMGELCGTSVSLRCQLPTEDLDALISIKSDEDLSNLLEEYNRIPSSSMKVRAFLSPKTSKPTTLSPSSSMSSSSLSPKSLSPSSSFSGVGPSPRLPPVPVMAYPMSYTRPSAGKIGGCHHCVRNANRVFLIHNGNHWQ